MWTTVNPKRYLVQGNKHLTTVDPQWLLVQGNTVHT
jgi:hypothetical protein